MRIASATFGLGGVTLYFLIVRRLAGARVATLAGLLVAFSPYFVYHAKFGRPYSQALFFAMAFTWVFFFGETWGRGRRRAALAVLTPLAIGSYYPMLGWFATFYLVVLADDLRRGRSDAFRDHFVTGAISLVGVVPVLVPLATSIGAFHVPYWLIGANSFSSVLAEEFFFAGTTLGGGGGAAQAVSLFLLALILAPAILLALGRRTAPDVHPVLTVLPLVAPGLLTAYDFFFARDVMFYPRGFIASAPFLFSGWVLCVLAVRVPRWMKIAYVAIVLLPFALSSLYVARVDARHPYYRGGDLMKRATDEIARLRQGDDLVLVHGWWVAPYLRYFLDGRAEVRGAGESQVKLAGPQGDVAVALAEVAALPDARRVLLVVNDLASTFADPRGEVERSMRASRPVLWERPCLEEPVPGFEWFCRRMILFGARSPAAAPPSDTRHP
jgi:hypothetical protein